MEKFKKVLEKQVRAYEKANGPESKSYFGVCKSKPKNKGTAETNKTAVPHEKRNADLK